VGSALYPVSKLCITKPHSESQQKGGARPLPALEHQLHIQSCPQLPSLELPSEDVTPGRQLCPFKTPLLAVTAAASVREHGGARPFPFCSYHLSHSPNLSQPRNTFFWFRIIELIIEWLGLEGTSEIILFQPPARGQWCQPLHQAAAQACSSQPGRSLPAAGWDVREGEFVFPHILN